MFIYEPQHWLAFFAAAMVLNLSPGPDAAFILGQTARGGKRAGLAAMLGIWTGALGHVALAAVGLSALLAASATAFSIVKWVGAAYLIWLGIAAIRSAGSGFAADGRPALGLGAVFRQGMLVNIMNPKVAIFFLAFLPQFVVPGAGPVPAQLALHGILVIACAGLVEPPLIFAGAAIANRIRRSKRFAAWLDRAMGGIFIALGARLASSGG
ncbi:LysE family translocator [Cucumibacter marinus]|uniref:LysE family translocator n=1 Tax=Cucumibacter marinus TaxID=1121252 RepID=UPI000414ECC3|nr:LysE family translocator [Cucumibacter marinus]